MDRNTLLKSSRAKFISLFNELIEWVVHQSMETLYRKADKSLNSQEQRHLLDARSFIARYEKELVRQIIHSIETLLNRSFQTAYDTFRPSFFNTSQATQIELLDVSTFEDDLRLDLITSRFRSEAGVAAQLQLKVHRADIPEHLDQDDLSDDVNEESESALQSGYDLFQPTESEPDFADEELNSDVLAEARVTGKAGNIEEDILVCLLCFSLMTPGIASEVQVAVAANFAAPMKQIAATFQQATGHKALLSFGATTKLYAQIKNGAPFDILLSADQTIPERLTQEHDAIAGSQFTYAVGKLVLWSATKNVVDAQGAVLIKGNFAKLAIASKQAPYGLAARETLKNLNLSDTFSNKIVQGESVGQTWSFVASGNATLGFIALSQVWESNKIKSGSAWIVPQHLYPPLRQDAVLLLHGENNPAARALLDYLKSGTAKQIIQSYGYQLP